MGFYQVEPGTDRYWLGSPLFDKASVKVGVDGKGRDIRFNVIAQNNSDRNRYIQSVTLNGKPYSKGYIEYKDITAGSTLVLNMGPQPAIWY
jgi:putative alpha-1,2-mannosidase